MSTEDHAWVVVVLEMTVVNLNTTRRRLFALDISKNPNRGDAVFSKSTIFLVLESESLPLLFPEVSNSCLESQGLPARPFLLPALLPPVHLEHRLLEQTAILSDGTLEEQYVFNLTSSGFCCLKTQGTAKCFQRIRGVEKGQG